MSHLYQYNSLESAPNQGMLQDAVESSSMAQTEWADISYHPGEKWLKIWFAEALSTDDQQILAALVSNSTGIKKFRVATGSVYFELVPTQGKRWERHRKRVPFQIPFNGEPKIVISNALFDGAAKLEILGVTEQFFDFRITSVNGGGQVRGLTTVEFDWEAKAWQA